jgi:hypothetical protein
MRSENAILRRALVASFGAGVAGVTFTAAVPAIAQTTKGSTAAPFVDPTTKYPSHHIQVSLSHGPAWPARWTLVQTMAKLATKAPTG